MADSPLVHIGYHKTASSWLQQAFFPALADSVALFEHPLLWEELMLPSGLVFNVSRCKEYLRQLSSDARSTGKLCVYSSERLSGNPHSGGYDAAEMANRVCEVFERPRILVVVREQRSILQSNFKQYIRMGGTCTLEEYLTPPWDGRVPHFRLDNFCYHHLLDYYGKLLGKEQVLALPYELLRSDPHEFSGALLDFMGLEQRNLGPEVFEQTVNPSMNDLQVRLKRWVNKLSGNDSLHPVKPLAPNLAAWLFAKIDALSGPAWAERYSSAMPERIESLIGDHYCESNRKLQDWMSCDLSKLGYRL